MALTLMPPVASPPHRTGPAVTFSATPALPHEEYPALSSRHTRASLEPWLQLLRRPGWQNGDLSLFLLEPVDDWQEEYALLVQALKEYKLPTDPYAGLQHQWAHSKEKELLQHVRSSVPKELWNTALSFTHKEQVLRLPLDLNPAFTDTLIRVERDVARRIQTGKAVHLPALPPPHMIWMTYQFPPELYSVYATDTAQGDVESLISAVFILQCRQRFAASARAMIEARAKSKVFKVVSGVLRLQKRKSQDHQQVEEG